MIAKDTRGYTVERRSSSVEASWVLEAAGAVAGDSPVQTRLADISEARLAESASSLCLTKKPWSVIVSMRNR